MFIVAVLLVVFLVCAAAVLGGLGVLAVYEVRQAAGGKLTISEQVWAFIHRWEPARFLAGLAIGIAASGLIWLLPGILAGHLFTCN